MQYGSKGFAAASRIPDFSDSLGATLPRIIFHTARRPRSCPIIPHIPAFCPTPGCRKGWFRSRRGLRRGLGVQEGAICSPEGLRSGLGVQEGTICSPESPQSGPGVQEGAICSREGPEKWSRGAERGGFAPRRVCKVVSGCRKGVVCSREGPRRVIGVQEGVVLLPGGSAKWSRGAGRSDFAPGRARGV